MNWGWQAIKNSETESKSYYDGFFYDGGLSVTTSNGLKQYTDRKDLVISKP